MKTPKVSVVMSVYKEPVEWLHQSIDSILNQTFSDFELIIISDNPAYEEGIETLTEYAAKDNRIILIFNEENIGLTKSLNKGLAIAKGEYIVRMDADDISMPERIERQVLFMDQNPHIAASGCSAITIDAQNRTLKKWKRETDPKIIRSQLLFKSPIIHPSAIFRRVIDNKLVMYDEIVKFAQDYALWSMLCGSHDLSNIKDYLLLYRLSDGQISSQKEELQMASTIATRKKVINNLLLKIGENGMDILTALLSKQKKQYPNKEVEDFIVCFVRNNRDNELIDIKVIAKYLLLLYCNYLPLYNTLHSSMYNYFVVSRKCSVFSMYSLLSLISKYIK